jgi:hypothetical protein
MLLFGSDRPKWEFNEALSMQFGDSSAERIAQATLRNNLGISYQLPGDLASAQTEFQTAFTLLGPVLDQAHPLMQAILYNLTFCASGGNLVSSSMDTAAKWAAFQAALGTMHPPLPRFGRTGIWIVPWEGCSFPVMLALAA